VKGLKISRGANASGGRPGGAGAGGRRTVPLLDCS
jgi:hypothetical protein